MSQDLVTLEIDGQTLQAPRGTMLIDVADAANIHIPRFCYHKKLSVAANCRMCLVEVEKAPKPLPACATPVMPGMKVFTRSPLALAAQRGTMEFLLINHPLDCPICDQGGECELQDVAMGYGDSVSRYSEAKRVVKDKDIGPLIETEMTRCIHCTRCVRFGEEIAGVRELGATGRGEFMRIGTFIEHTVSHELSGNVIDLCPVGALTAKPSRYRARAWEYRQAATISPHDGVGANVFVHTYNGRVFRVVPRENEAVNETWISDRDRFSYTGLYAEERLTQPRIKSAGQWRDATWEEALAAVVAGLRGAGPEATGAWISPSVTLEEMYLAQKVLRGIGVKDIDHRVGQLDFTVHSVPPLFPWLGCSIEELERMQSVMLIGCNPRQEQPLLAHRLRKAALHGAQVSVVHSQTLNLNYPAGCQLTGGLRAQIVHLAGIAAAAAGERALPADLQALVDLAVAEPAYEPAAQQAMADNLARAERSLVLVGADAIASPVAGLIGRLAEWIADATGSRLGYLPAGSNAGGAWLSGVLPFRGPAGQPVAVNGADFGQQATAGRKAFVLCGIDPERDCADPLQALRTLDAADFVVAMTSFVGADLEASANVLLPMAALYETTGTLVNAEGRWQSVRAAANLPGEVRPGWKIWRVLGNLFDLPGLDYLTSEQVRDELKALLPDQDFSNKGGATNVVPLAPALPEAIAGLQRLQVRGLYTSDPLVRRAAPLQEAPEGRRAATVRVHPLSAGELADGSTVRLREGRHETPLTLVVDSSVPPGVALTVAGSDAVSRLGAPGAHVNLAQA